MSMMDTLFGQIEACAQASDPSSAAFAFADALKPYGLCGIGTRAYRLPEGRIEARGVWKAGGAVATVWPKGWADAPGFQYICFEENPLLAALQERRSFFRYTDFAPRDTHGAYWEAFSEGRITEGLGTIAFGRGRSVASIAMTFERLEMSPGELAAVRTAAAVLAERTAALTIPDGPAPRLTGREYDCLAYVAAGKSDWEISVILSLSQATVRFHVDNARRKLGATTRAHAVARALALSLI